MKTFNFSGRGAQVQGFSYEILLTSEELAEHLNLSVAEVEAMGEDEVQALIVEKRWILEYLIHEGEVDVDWGDSGVDVYSDIDVDIEEGA